MLMRMLVKTTQAFRNSPPMSGRFGLIACGGVCVYPLSAVVLIMVPPLRRVTFGKRRVSDHPKSNQKVLALPYGRLAKARRCPHSGTVLGARRDGPSMAHRGWRGVLPRHPHNSTCVRPSVMGIRVVWTYVWLQQKQKQNPSQTPQNPAQNVLAPTYKPLTSRTRLRSIAQRSQTLHTRSV